MVNPNFQTQTFNCILLLSSSASYSTMVEMKLLLFLLIFFTACDGINCMKYYGRVDVSLFQLQWGNEYQKTTSNLPQMSRKSKKAIKLELKQQQTPPSLKTVDIHQHILTSDSHRIAFLQSQINSKSAQTPLTSGAPFQTLNYIINIKLGSQTMPVIVDTGSDLTWTQCKPCTYCYSQRFPLYDPNNSNTYKSIPCNSTSCTGFLSYNPGSCGLGRSNNACNYALRYGDGSYTRGELALERVYFGDVFVDGFVFGCGRSNRGLFGGVSGLLGLGRTPVSLVSQTKAQFGGVFSYCLPSKPYNSTGNLVLGNDPTMYKNTTPISYTNMIQGDAQQAPFYFLNLTMLRVGGVTLTLSKDVKVLIDSGTVITRLVPSIYNAVRNEFVKQFSEYPKANEFSILDTCFDLSKYDRVLVPKLGLGFEGGVDVNVDMDGIFYFAKKDASQVCLAMASLVNEDAIGIIGNYQQKNQRIVYDCSRGMVGFGQEDCSHSEGF